MALLTKRFEKSPALARVLPFLVFLGLTFGQGKLGAGSAYWIYLAKTVIGAGLLWLSRPFIPEMRWRVSWEAVAAGLVVLAVWIGIDGFYPKMGKVDAEWNPFHFFGQSSGVAWLVVGARLVGSTLVVPPLEEVFYRSFVYRYLINADFLSVPLGQFRPVPFVVTSLMFGFEHSQWLAGIFCGLVFQFLVWKKARLGDAMAAHAITNLLLGVWVLTRDAWSFW